MICINVYMSVLCANFYELALSLVNSKDQVRRFDCFLSKHSYSINIVAWIIIIENFIPKTH